MRVGWIAGAVALLALAVALWSSRESSSPVAPRTVQPTHVLVGD